MYLLTISLPDIDSVAMSLYDITHYICRAASVSERSEANDRVLFELPLYLQYIYIYIPLTW